MESKESRGDGMNGHVNINPSGKLIVGHCKASELRGQFQELKEFMMRIEAGG